MEILYRNREEITRTFQVKYSLFLKNEKSVFQQTQAMQTAGAERQKKAARSRNKKTEIKYK